MGVHPRENPTPGGVTKQPAQNDDHFEGTGHAGDCSATWGSLRGAREETRRISGILCVLETIIRIGLLQGGWNSLLRG